MAKSGREGSGSTWVATGPRIHQQELRPATTPGVSSYYGQPIVGDELAGSGQGFQRQVYMQLHAIERKLDSLADKLTSATEQRPPQRKSSPPSTRASVAKMLPGVLGDEAIGQEVLQRPISAPPAKRSSVVDAWKEEAPPVQLRKQKTEEFKDDLMPSLFQRSSTRIKPATVLVPSVQKRVLQWFEELLGLNQFWSSRDMAMKRCKQTKLWRLVHSVPFQVAISLVIVINALFIGLTADAELSAFMRKEMPDKKWAHADSFFCVVFLVELLLRAISERGLFLYGEEWMWNYFDTLLIISSLVDTLLNNHEIEGMGNLGTARVWRFVRFVRLIRLARAAHAIQSLRLFILSMFSSGISLLWCALMLSVIVYFFALCFLNGVTEYFRDGTGNAEEQAMVAEMYGSVSLAMVTLFMCISGGIDWQDAMNPLVNVHWVYKPTFVFFVFFMFFGVLNIVVGAFVTASTDISKKDKELFVSAELAAADEYTKKIKRFFAEADKDNSGMLTWDEFEEHLKHPKVSAYFASLELDASNAHRLFRLLDADGSNEVGVDEFLDGCTRLKGQARSIDVNMLVYEIERMSRQVSHITDAYQDGRLWLFDSFDEQAEARQIYSKLPLC